jgi:hypothetical protein
LEHLLSFEALLDEVWDLRVVGEWIFSFMAASANLAAHRDSLLGLESK